MLMDFLHDVRSELDPFVVIETLVSELNSVDFSDVVIVVETHNDLSHDHIESRAKSSAGYDTRTNLLWIEVEISARATSKEFLCFFDGIEHAEICLSL